MDSEARERELVITGLIRRLKACGIHPELPFVATWDGKEWTFTSDADVSSSSSRESK